MDTQVDYAVGMPIGLLDDMPPQYDATESLFSAPEGAAAKSGSRDVLTKTT